MLKLNSERLEAEIVGTIKSLKRLPFVEDECFAIATVGDLQVQVMITRNEDMHLPDMGGFAEVED